MLVHPIVAPQVDWNTFIGICKDELGFTPTDMSRFDLKDPRTLSSSLALQENFNHVSDQAKAMSHFGFIIGSSRINLLHFSSISGMESSLMGDIGVFVGNLEAWRKTCDYLLSPEINRDIRDIAKVIYDYMCKLGFKDMWEGKTIKEDRKGWILV